MLDEKNDPRTVLLQLAASFTLADHMGDVFGGICEALNRIGVDTSDCDDDAQLAKMLHGMGVKTLYETTLGDDDIAEITNGK